MPHHLTQAGKTALTRLGLSVGRHANTLAGARRALLRGGEITTLVDVGAHEGEYAGAARGDGYRGAIVSFEPVHAHFERLAERAGADPDWTVHNAGAGSAPGNATIHVSGNAGFSSSLLDMTAAHLRAVSDSAYERSEEIEVVTLDEALGDEAGLGGCYLKIDTQGYEKPVLEGAGAFLERCRAVELELSLRPLYEGQALIGQMVTAVREAGLAPTHIEPEFIDPASGELLQVNGLFRRL